MKKANEFLYPDIEAGKKLIEEFGDNPSVILRCQDWEYTYPKLKDIDKYLGRYLKTNTTKKEKRVLASFVFEVCEEKLRNDYKSNENDVREILKMLFNDFDVNKHQFNYWSSWETKEKEDRWYIAEITREFNVLTED